MATSVVIWDPSGDLRVGEQLEGSRSAAAAASGVALLPIEPHLLERCAAGGYMRLSYGRGVQFGLPLHRRGCMTLLYVVPEHDRLSWAARLVPTGDEELMGSIRLVADSAQAGTIRAGLAPEGPAVDVGLLGEPVDGGWVVRGSARLSVGVEGFLGLCLYGQLRGCAVEWLAVSQHS